MSPVVGYYGKLPLSPEFLRLHAAGPELRWLDDWLQRGVLYAKSKEGPQWSALVAQSDLWNFLYVPPGQGRIVCGVLFASQDKAGRSFPFLSFLLLDLDFLSRKPWLVPIVAAEFLESTTSSTQVLRTTLDWDNFRRGVDQAEGKVLSVEAAEEAFAQYTQAVNAREWWVGLWGSFDDSRKYRLVQELAEMVRSFTQQACREASWGLKFPLFPGTGGKTYDLPFWLAASLQPVSPGPQHKLGVVTFWSRSPTKVDPCVLISLGPGSPNMTRFLVSPEAQDNSWRDVLSDNQNPAELAETMRHEGYRTLSDGALSIDKLLEYFVSLGRTQPC